MAPQAIQLPDSPPLDPRQTQGLLSPWHAPRYSLSGEDSSPYSQSPTMQYRDRLINTAEKLHRRFMRVWNGFSLLQKILAVIVIITLNVLTLLFLIFSEKIFAFLGPLAQRWKNTPGGWIILWLITFCTAFPPVIGYGTCGTTAGFVYGAGEGWLILATATVAGSFCSFIVSRTILKSYVERMVAHDKRFAALTLTLKQDGLKLLCMIRLCPLPYSLSNGAMSTFPTVHPAMYAAATALITPKLLIHTFIGSRLAAIANSDEEMSAGTKALNGLVSPSLELLGRVLDTTSTRRLWREPESLKPRKQPLCTTRCVERALRPSSLRMTQKHRRPHRCWPRKTLWTTLMRTPPQTTRDNIEMNLRMMRIPLDVAMGRMKNKALACSANRRTRREG